MEQITATRTSLLRCRTRISLAARGRDVLKEKRDQLMEQFRATVDVAVSGGGALESAAAGVVLGDSYPHPIVDHAEARERALTRYKRGLDR